MREKINQYIEEAGAFFAQSADEIEQFRIRYLGRKGLLNDLFEEFKTVPGEHKKLLGQELNRLKNVVQEKIDSYSQSTGTKTGNEKKEDLTRPGGLTPP